MPAAGSRCQTSRQPSVKMRPRPLKPLGRLRLCVHQPSGRQRPVVQPQLEMVKTMHAATIREVETSCVEHACILQQSHSDCMQSLEREAIEEDGETLPIFPNCLWSGTVMSVPPRSTWDTHVPTTIVNREHVLGCSLGQFPPAIHNNRGTCLCNSPSSCAGSPCIQTVQCHSSREEATGPATPTKQPTCRK